MPAPGGDFGRSGIAGGKALSSRPAGTKLLAVARKSKPVIVVAKFDRLFRSIADAAQTVVDFDRMGIELAGFFVLSFSFIW
jgi:DNA invertase Pin-like site-specific DNA recombinase